MCDMRGETIGSFLAALYAAGLSNWAADYAGHVRESISEVDDFYTFATCGENNSEAFSRRCTGESLLAVLWGKQLKPAVRGEYLEDCS